MAVYTSIDKQTLGAFLEDYKIGELKIFEGILEGVENTNYKIHTTNGLYILTIFEKRVKGDELPFFIELQKHLSVKKIKCPTPIINNNNEYISIIKGKKSVIMSYLDGNKLNYVDPNHCYQVGEEIAKIHLNTKDFNLSRKNNLNQLSWKKIFDGCKKINTEKYNGLNELIDQELLYLNDHWPNNLPEGVIHADVFQDNVFFINNKLSGLIDFYFACNDYYAYELAICINAWCFDQKGNFDSEKFQSIISGYQNLKKLSSDEYSSLKILLRGAAIRFLLTRLNDKLFHPANAFVKPKDPMEYLKILNFHQENDIL